MATPPGLESVGYGPFEIHPSWYANEVDKVRVVDRAAQTVRIATGSGESTTLGLRMANRLGVGEKEFFVKGYGTALGAAALLAIGTGIFLSRRSRQKRKTAGLVQHLDRQSRKSKLPGQKARSMYYAEPPAIFD